MFSKVKPIEWCVAAALLSVAVFFWYKNYFIQDDAYIAFVYAKNFAHGHGLVWYPGLDEYGYTNFLYTLLVGTVMFWLQGVDPEYISATFNFTAYLAALIITYLLTFRLSGSKFAGACAVIILATHHTFSAYASGGLETMVVTTLIIGFYYTLFSYNSPLTTRHYTLAILSSVALLTRLDSALLLFPGYVYLLYRHCEEQLTTKPSSNWFAALLASMTSKSLWLAAGIPTLCVLALLGWAKLYYGYALPNTFYAKIPGDTSMVLPGQRYIMKYLELHHYIPAVLLGLAMVVMVFSFIRHPRESGDQARIWIPAFASMATFLATIALWLVYVVYVGGCFMEFRLLVPILPMFAVVVLVSLKQMNRKKALIFLYISTTLAALHGNQQHHQILAKDRIFLPELIETTFGLNYWMNYPQGSWRMIGNSLKQLFGEKESSELLFAITASGAIPYYSGMHFLDVHGINHRAIAGVNAKLFDYRSPENRKPLIPRTGHRQIATDNYMIQAGVVLNFFHPHALCPHGKNFVISDTLSRTNPMRRNRTLLLPLANRCYLVADYLVHNSYIDDLISNGTILDYRVHKNKFKCPKWLCLN